VNRVKGFICLVFVSFLFNSCTPLIKTEESTALKDLEKDKYQLVNDLMNNNATVLQKGTIIRVMVLTSSEWIKVYALNDSEDPVSVQRYLMLYLFDDDFPNKVFSSDVFKERFAKYAVKIDPSKPVTGTKEKKAAPKK
jgi:type II secretion system-associated lipoprotein